MANRNREERRHRRNLARALARARSESPAKGQEQPRRLPSADQSKSLSHQLIGLAHRSGSRVWQAFLAFAILLGVVVGYYSLRPQISVTAAQSMNKGWLFEPMFTVTNVGYADIYNATFACAPLYLQRADRDLHDLQLQLHNHFSNQAGNNIGPELVLKPQTPVVKTCAFTSQVDGSHAETVWISLVINFRPSFWFGRLTKIVRYKSRTDPNGQIQWIADPSDDPYAHP